MGDGEHDRPSTEASRIRALKIRAAVLRAIREFFFRRDFLEVETPVRLRAPALETHIDAEPSGDCFLRTSPELHMKRLLAGGLGKIWQMGPCFRRGEQGRLHHPEYTMLEWYRAGGDYIDILADTKALITFVARAVSQWKCEASSSNLRSREGGGGAIASGQTVDPGLSPDDSDGASDGEDHGTVREGASDTIVYNGQQIDLLPRWHVLTVRDAFLQFARWDPVKQWDEDRFNMDLVTRVEPQLPRDVPVILKDYPAPAAALARKKPDDPAVAERWELYLGGMEIANAYSELADPAEQRARFEDCAKQREKLGKHVYPLDEKFLGALQTMPPSGGIALGVDRLVMLFADAYAIDEVTAFQE